MKAGNIEYKMTAQMAKTLISKESKKIQPQKILCDYVNGQCGLKGLCTKVIIFDE